MNASTSLAERLLGAEGRPAGICMEFDLAPGAAGNAAHAWQLLGQLDTDGAVIGLGRPLLDAAHIKLPGLRAFTPLEGVRHHMPASQHALWVYLVDQTPGAAFLRADALAEKLQASFTLADSTTMWRYRDGHDLTGYRDGITNPHGEAALAAAIAAGADDAGGSYVITQRYLHDRQGYFRRPQKERDNIMGRDQHTEEELADAPESAHVKRTEQEAFDPEAFMVRRSMPWGDMLRHGLNFIGFVAELSTAERQLNRMLGRDDGIADAILDFSQAQTGAYYFCPAIDGGRLRLPA